MFRHHKYCVIEVSGQLMAETSPQGDLCLYLLDESTTSASDHQRLRIADPEFTVFVRQSGAVNRPRLAARITGTVDLESQPVSLLGITRAILQGADGGLTYEPRSHT